MKIYTKKGDDGTTLLFGGVRLNKDDARIESYGALDELNAFLGLLADQLQQSDQNKIRLIQSKLFDLGAILATAPGKTAPCQPPSPQDIKQLEDDIDEMDMDLPVLQNFILPGGHTLVSTAHVCRTICRRAEREVVRLSHSADVPSQIVIYLNRLSDFLFLLSRKIAADLDVEEIRWMGSR